MTTFHSNIINIYGTRGKAWLNALPEFVTSISSKLGLRDLKAVKNLTHNYVLSGLQGDSPIILKLGLDHDKLTREAFTLKCFESYGAVKVLAEDDGILLLERAVPGRSLKTYIPSQHNESIEILCKVMKRLHQATIPKNHTLPHIQDWLTSLDRHCAEFTTKQAKSNNTQSIHCACDDMLLQYLQTALRLRDQLLKTSQPDALLHGDLHHDNILRNDDDWVVIDPKGVIGTPMNEIWAFVKDIKRDIPFIAQYFHFRTQDLFDWYFVHLILAICWNLEDNLDTTLFIKLAEKAYKYIS